MTISSFREPTLPSRWEQWSARQRCRGYLGALILSLLAWSLAAEPRTASILARNGHKQSRIRSSTTDSIEPTAYTVRLVPGEEKVISVSSRLHWNHTYIAVEVGEVYEVAARIGSSWKDACRVVSARGYESWLLTPFRRLRRRSDASWFELIGGVGESESKTFRLDEWRPATIQTAGELVLYANDARFMYWNNSGRLDVVVRRVR